MSTECPTCGRHDFKSETGMKQHHGRTHGESLSSVSLECEWCGDEYTRLQSKAENSRFCSNECKLDGFHEQQRGREIVELVCDYCGVEFEREAGNNKDSEKDFCSRECHSDWLAENNTGEDHHNWKGGDVEVECCVCGDTLYRRPNVVESEERHFCYEKGCRYDWISENHSGENHSRWKGGVKHGYPGKWGEVRKRIRERDNHKCRCCGISQEEHKEKYGFNLDVHHIVPVRKFDDPADAHNPENLVTACRSCHTKYEGVPVFPH